MLVLETSLSIALAHGAGSDRTGLSRKRLIARSVEHAHRFAEHEDE